MKKSRTFTTDMRYLLIILGASISLAYVTAKTEVVVPEVASVTHAPETEPKKEKVSYLKRIKTFFQVLGRKLFPSQDPAYYIVSILLALLFSPLGILVAGLWAKDDRWILHTLLNLLVIILAIVFFFITCGIGVYVTWLMILGAFIHALWYIIDRGK